MRAEIPGQNSLWCNHCGRKAHFWASTDKVIFHHTGHLCAKCGSTGPFQQSPKDTLKIMDEKPGPGEGHVLLMDGRRIPARQDITVLGPDAPYGCLKVEDERRGRRHRKSWLRAFWGHLRADMELFAGGQG